MPRVVSNANWTPLFLMKLEKLLVNDHLQAGVANELNWGHVREETRL